MNKKSVLGTTIASVFSAILAFFGVVTCCGMPIVAGALAFFGVGASQLAFFAEYRGIFMLIAVISLIFGFWQVYFRNKISCCETKPKSTKFQQIFLWIAAVIVIGMLFWGQPNVLEKTEEPTPSCCPKN